MRRRIPCPSNELLLHCYISFFFFYLMKAKNIIIQFWSINGSDSIFSLYVVLNVNIYHEKKFAVVR